MNPSSDINISRSLSESVLSPVGENESQDLLSPTNADHREDIDSELDLEPDSIVDRFMENDAAVRHLHPGSKAPEKGFLERHKALGVFLISATIILAVGVVAGSIAGFIIGIMAAAGTPAGALLAAFSSFIFMGVGAVLTAPILLTGYLIQKTFKENFRMSSATQSLQQKLREPMGAEEAKAKARTTKEIFRGLEAVKTSPGGSSRSVGEIDFLVKYSQLPDDLKRDLLARFFKERTKGTEAPATLLKIEEREFESTQKLHSGLLDTLSLRLRIDRTDIPEKERNESWKDYYENIFAIVKENKFYQALPQERRNEIEALSAHPATQLFHAAQDLQAVEEAVGDGAAKVLQEQMLNAVTATRTEQVTSGAEAIKQWMNSDGGQKTINDRLTALKRSWTYVPIIVHTPLPAQ
jgi:hypothetical protein